MVIDLRECAEAAVHVERAFDVSEMFASDPEVEQVRATQLVLDVSKVGEEKYIASGRFETEVVTCCARCLEPFTSQLGGSFRVIYLPEPDRPTPHPGESALDCSRIDVSYYKENQLEVIPLLVEQISLSFPMRFLCRESCKGLCPHCGANRNETDCACRPDSPPSAFESLKNLLN